MLEFAEVIYTKKAYKTNQFDDEGNALYNKSVKVRIGGDSTILGQVRNVWAAPATFNSKIPLIGEQVIVFRAPASEFTSAEEKNSRYYYLVPYNTVNDLTLFTLPKIYDRFAAGVGSFTPSAVLNDRKQHGYTISVNPGQSQMLQPFEGDDIWEGRFGQSIRFTREYSYVNFPGTSIYEKQSTRNWKASSSKDSMIIMKVKRPSSGDSFDLEDLGKDESSIYLATRHKLLKFSAGFKINSDARTASNWNSGSQIIIDSDRIVLNAKKDKTLLIGNKQIITTAKKVLLQSQKHKVDLDDLMEWLHSITRELFLLATAQKNFLTAMGPTGPTTNVAEITTIHNVEFNKRFKIP